MTRDRFSGLGLGSRSSICRLVARFDRAGLTLLETMVALVILGLVVLGYLELFTASSRSTRQAEIWSQAVAYAEEAMETVKIDPAESPLGREPLTGGFERVVESRSWDAATQLVTVVVYLPEGGSFTVSRLFGARP